MLIKLENGTPVGNPVTEENFRMLFPSTSFPYPLTPSDLDGFGFGLYEYSHAPIPELYEKVVEVTPTCNESGLWLQTWDVVEMSEPEKAAKDEEVALRVRAERDFKLGQTDAYIVRNAELGTPIPTEVTTYRQALRDVPEQQGFPHNVVWPEMAAPTDAPDWVRFYQGLLTQAAFSRIRTAAASSTEIAVAYADAAIALTQAAIQRVNVPAIQSSLDNLLGLMSGDNFLSQQEQDGLVELLQSCSLEDTITLTFAV